MDYLVGEINKTLGYGTDQMTHGYLSCFSCLHLQYSEFSAEEI